MRSGPLAHLRRHCNHRLLCHATLTSHLLTIRPQLQEVYRFMIETLTLMPVPERVANDAPRNSRPEVVAVVEPVHCVNHVFLGKAGILQVRKLMAAFVRDGLTRQETFAM